MVRNIPLDLEPLLLLSTTLIPPHVYQLASFAAVEHKHRSCSQVFMFTDTNHYVIHALSMNGVILMRSVIHRARNESRCTHILISNLETRIRYTRLLSICSSVSVWLAYDSDSYDIARATGYADLGFLDYRPDLDWPCF